MKSLPLVTLITLPTVVRKALYFADLRMPGIWFNSLVTDPNLLEEQDIHYSVLQKPPYCFDVNSDQLCAWVPNNPMMIARHAVKIASLSHEGCKLSLTWQIQSESGAVEGIIHVTNKNNVEVKRYAVEGYEDVDCAIRLLCSVLEVDYAV